MSGIAGLSTQEAELWRPTASHTAAGDATETYAAAPTYRAMPVLVEQMSNGRRVRLFGVDSAARYVGLVDRGWAVQRGDVLKIIHGRMTGRYLLVGDVVESEGADEDVLGLLDTKERPDG